MSTAPYTICLPPLECPAVFVVGFAVSEAIQTKYAGRVKFNLSPVKTITKPYHLPVGVTGVYAYTFANSELQALRAVCKSARPPANCCAFTSENQLLRYLAEQFGEPIPPEEAVQEYAADIPSASEGPRSVAPMSHHVKRKPENMNGLDDDDDEDVEAATDEELGLEVLVPVSEVATAPDHSSEIARIRSLKCWTHTLSSWARDEMNYPCVPVDEARRLLPQAIRLFPKVTQQVLYITIRQLLKRADLPT